MQSDLTLKRAKAMARTLQSSLKSDGPPANYAACLEVVARMQGFETFNALQASVPEKEAATRGTGAPNLTRVETPDLHEEVERRGFFILLGMKVDRIVDEYPGLTRAQVFAARQRLQEACDYSSMSEAYGDIEHRIFSELQAESPGRLDPIGDGPLGVGLARILACGDFADAAFDADPDLRATHLTLDPDGALHAFGYRRTADGGIDRLDLRETSTPAVRDGAAEELTDLKQHLEPESGRIGLIFHVGAEAFRALVVEDHPLGRVDRLWAVENLEIDDWGELFDEAPALDAARQELIETALPDLAIHVPALDGTGRNPDGPVEAHGDAGGVRACTARIEWVRELAGHAFAALPEAPFALFSARLGEPDLRAAGTDGARHAVDLDDLFTQSAVVDLRRIANGLKLQAGSCLLVVERAGGAWLFDDPAAPRRVWAVAQDGRDHAPDPRRSRTDFLERVAPALGVDVSALESRR